MELIMETHNARRYHVTYKPGNACPGSLVSDGRRLNKEITHDVEFGETKERSPWSSLRPNNYSDRLHDIAKPPTTST
jgi:hypothetical protein